MRSWSLDDNIWKRSSAIICQVGLKQTDVGLLFDCIDPNLSHPDFFIRKGIGWALCHLAPTSLEAIESYVSRNQSSLNSPSRSELAHLRGNAEECRLDPRKENPYLSQF